MKLLLKKNYLLLVCFFLIQYLISCDWETRKKLENEKTKEVIERLSNLQISADQTFKTNNLEGEALLESIRKEIIKENGAEISKSDPIVPFDLNCWNEIVLSKSLSSELANQNEQEIKELKNLLESLFYTELPYPPESTDAEKLKLVDEKIDKISIENKLSEVQNKLLKKYLPIGVFNYRYSIPKYLNYENELNAIFKNDTVNEKALEEFNLEYSIELSLEYNPNLKEIAVVFDQSDLFIKDHCYAENKGCFQIKVKLKNDNSPPSATYIRIANLANGVPDSNTKIPQYTQQEIKIERSKMRAGLYPQEIVIELSKNELVDEFKKKIEGCGKYFWRVLLYRLAMNGLRLTGAFDDIKRNIENKRKWEDELKNLLATRFANGVTPVEASKQVVDDKNRLSSVIDYETMVITIEKYCFDQKKLGENECFEEIGISSLLEKMEKVYNKITCPNEGCTFIEILRQFTMDLKSTTRNEIKDIFYEIEKYCFNLPAENIKPIPWKECSEKLNSPPVNWEKVKEFFSKAYRKYEQISKTWIPNHYLKERTKVTATVVNSFEMFGKRIYDSNIPVSSCVKKEDEKERKTCFVENMDEIIGKMILPLPLQPEQKKRNWIAYGMIDLILTPYQFSDKDLLYSKGTFYELLFAQAPIPYGFQQISGTCGINALSMLLDQKSWFDSFPIQYQSRHRKNLLELQKETIKKLIYPKPESETFQIEKRVFPDFNYFLLPVIKYPFFGVTTTEGNRVIDNGLCPGHVGKSMELLSLNHGEIEGGDIEKTFETLLQKRRAVQVYYIHKYDYLTQHPVAYSSSHGNQKIIEAIGWGGPHFVDLEGVFKGFNDDLEESIYLIIKNPHLAKSYLYPYDDFKWSSFDDLGSCSDVDYFKVGGTKYSPYLYLE